MHAADGCPTILQSEEYFEICISFVGPIAISATKRIGIVLTNVGILYYDLYGYFPLLLAIVSALYHFLDEALMFVVEDININSKSKSHSSQTA